MASWPGALAVRPETAGAGVTAEGASGELTPAHLDLLRTIQSMTAAVKAQDSAKYTALIDPSDERFVKERKAWIASVKDSPFARFRLWIEMPGRMYMDGTQAEVALHEVVALTQEEEDTRSVVFPARFVKTEAGWKFAGVKWEAAEIEGGSLRWCLQTAPASTVVRERWHELRAAVHASLGFTPRPEYRVQFTLTPEGSKDWLKDDGDVSDPQGWYSAGRIHMVEMDGAGMDNLLATMVHEYAHAMHEEMVEDMSVSPRWVAEALAQLVEHEIFPKVPPVYTEYPGEVHQSTVVAWSSLGKGEDPEAELAMYAQGHSMIQRLDNRFGREKVMRWIRELGIDGDLDRSSRVAFGQSWEKVEQDWMKCLAP